MRAEHGILLIMILLGTAAVYNIVIGSLTVLEYYETEIAGLASTGASFRLAMATFILVLVYGMAKRKGWALFLSIAFMLFGIIESAWNIIYTRLFELPSTFGIVGVILFSLSVYYLTRKEVRMVFRS